jgi:hypothetical protein
MRSLHVLGVTVLLLVQAAWASPTANEFERCHQGAALRLQHCLSEAGGGDGDACWSGARSYHGHCREAVVLEHQKPDAARIEATRKAMQQAAGARPAQPAARPADR